MLFMRQDYENKKNYHQIKQCLKDIELCDTLRQHIHKENHILYPMAIRTITEDSEWDKMKIKCDEIGYCCFCPSHNQTIYPENNSKSIIGKCE